MASAAEAVDVRREGYERTLYEAKLDVDFAVRLALLHERLYGRIKKLITVVNLLAGTTAVASLIEYSATLSAVAGAVVAVTSILDLVYDYGGKAAAHCKDRRAYLDLLGRADRLTPERLDARFAMLNRESTIALECLAMPAYNHNLARHGRTGWCVPLTRWERFMAWLA